MATYTVKGLPWRSGLGKDVSDCKTSEEVLIKSGLNFNVEKCPIMAKMSYDSEKEQFISSTMGDFAYDGNIYRPCPNGYATYRTDKNVPLGIVKSKYEVVQNTDAFRFFDEAIGGVGGAVWDTAGYFGHGEKVFITAKLPITTTVNGDAIDNYLVFANSHDGSSSIFVMFTPIRCICTNCLNSALRNADAYIRIRHTESASSNLQKGIEVLKAAIQYAKTSEELYNSLTKIKMTDEQVMEYISTLYLSAEENFALKQYDEKNGYKKLVTKEWLALQRTKISTRKANIIASINDYYHNGIGQRHIIGTAWGAYNAITGYMSNVNNVDGQKRMDNLLWSSGNNKMLESLNKVLEYA